jgi:hypothetical protein
MSTQAQPRPTKTVRLNATSAREARKEIQARWPHLEVNYKGYDTRGECVLMSTVRKQGDKAYVATARRNRHDLVATSFDAEIPV